ncbi:MAG: hypothetical protein ACXVGQ_14000 [Mycobacteriaceae bacterium]
MRGAQEPDTDGHADGDDLVVCALPRHVLLQMLGEQRDDGR